MREDPATFGPPSPADHGPIGENVTFPDQVPASPLGIGMPAAVAADVMASAAPVDSCSGIDVPPRRPGVLFWTVVGTRRRPSTQTHDVTRPFL